MEQEETVVETGADAPSSATVTRRTATITPSGGEQARRIIVLIFGLIQILIGLRIVLLLVDARQANGIVNGILDLSQIFVAPFDGILRTDYLHASGATLDVTAVVAFVGWTVLELIIIWVVSIFRREPA
jgi:hypothetical protein